MSETVQINAAKLFAHEIRQAQKLGFKLTVLPGKTVKVRMVPVTAEARLACLRATRGQLNQQIEAAVPVTTDTADALREAIHAALAMARAVV